MSVMNGKPRWKLESERRRAQAAYELLNSEDRALIEPRLSPGCAERFMTDIVRLGSARPEAIQVLSHQKSATAAEHATAAEGHDLVMRVREAAKRRAPGDTALHKAMGVGDGLKQSNTDGVLAMLNNIVNLAGDDHKALERIGVLQSDIKEAQFLALALTNRDHEQRHKKATRVTTTSERNKIRLSIETAIDEMAAAGKLAFRKDPARRARYEALVASIVGEEESEQPEAETPPAEPESDAPKTEEIS